MRFGRERLREREAEFERAMRVNNCGLRSHLADFSKGKEDEVMKDV